MHLLLDSSYFPSSWGGVIYRENGERVAGVRYAESAGKGVLTLSSGETSFEVHAATESFSGSSTNKGGRMLCNGKHVYSFTSSTPALLEVRTADLRGARTVFRTHLDSWNRRFCWAYRQGFSWFRAWQYAGWGHMLVGRKCCFSSLFAVNAAPRSLGKLRHPLFHEADEAVWLGLEPVEQLLVLALSVQGLCGMYNCKVSTPLSSIFSRNCPAVPSFVINGNGKCDINPARFHRRWLGEFLATGHPITWLLIIAIWLPYATHPQRDEMGFLLMSCIFTALGLGWMLICRWANRHPEPMEW